MNDKMVVYEKKLLVKYICNFSVFSVFYFVENLLFEFVFCKNKFVCFVIGF